MMQYIYQGGVVLWVIFAGTAAIFFLFVQRWVHVHRASLRGRDFLSGIFLGLHRGNILEAAAMCEDTPGPVAQMTRAAILDHQRGGGRTEQVMQEVGVQAITRMERNLPLLLALAQAAPMLGLLGTAIGMWEMLDVLNRQAPLLHAGDVGGGLSLALITTIAGLATGVFGYVAHAFLVNRISAVVIEMERAYTEVLRVLRELPPPEGKG
ncbi:MAG TPA: MotA/TolQ/ExbB proton channel family protein [Kiritimatiellia bacterium]|nr:MotA/TolQ/ExbB proton channel family protein [Kiritimatiellia bacterium]